MAYAGLLGNGSAGASTRDQDWPAATKLWASVSSANPVNGDYWARLGEARFGVRDYARARQAYQQALRLGLRETSWSEAAPPLMPGGGRLPHRLL